MSVRAFDLARDRESLDLVRACNEILDRADDPGTDPLADLCATIARTVPCEQASMLLADAADDPAVDGADPAVDAAVRQAVLHGRPVFAGPLMAVPLRSGGHVWGALVCTGRPGGFTDADLDLLAPIVPHVARYCGERLYRRAILAENESWRALAAGITAFNRLLAKEVRRKAADDGRVYRAASTMVRQVLPDVGGCDIGGYDRTAASGPRPEARDRAPARDGGPVAPLAAEVLRSCCQRSTTDPDELRAEGLDPAVRWLVCSPIRVSDDVYGVLNVYGPGATPPSNARQVCEIVADQLGLYRRLRKAYQELDHTVQGQAHAMEDLQHQLMSPLLVAVGRTDRMLDGCGLAGRLDVDVRSLRAVRGLCRQASRVAMSAHIFAALSTGRAPSARIERLTSEELIRLVIAAADDTQLLSDSRRRIRFDVDRRSVHAFAPRRVEADLSFLEQCLGNLLDNAAKYSYQGTRVEIHGTVEEHAFSVAVTSTGLPMTDDDAHHCLQRGWRGTTAAGVTGEGSGLGLWIVDNLMKSMGGTVRIEPSGDRTTIVLTFPLSPT